MISPRLKRFTCLVMLVLLTGCSLLPKEEIRRNAPLLVETESEKFKLSYVTRGDLKVTSRVSCTYVPIQKINMTFGVSGEYIDEIYIQVGDIVKKGQVLGQLRMDGVEETIKDLNFSIDSAKLSIEQLNENRVLEIERTKLVHASDPEKMQKSLDEIEKNYALSIKTQQDAIFLYEMELQSAYELKRKRQLISPIDGTITYVRKYTESSVSDENERAATVVDTTMSLFSASSDKWDLFSVGDTYTITCKKTEYEATVIDPYAYGIDPGKREIGTRANVYLTLSTPSLKLEDNDKGTLELVLDSRTDVLIVHEDAISSADGEAIAYILGKDGMKTYKKVKVGLKAGKYYEVLEGLEEGEEVIVG
ncbi:MAG: efflux RND transporter periplasmic adaptor subunit [Clostridia bacterium]|nr:efflux RND transporter periplasmic adaptor subunit [Clostridia bacterium]